MGSAAGAMEYVTVSPHAALVCEKTKLVIRVLTTPSLFPLQAVRPAGAPASYTARTDSACAVCSIKALDFPVMARLVMAIASFTAG